MDISNLSEPLPEVHNDKSKEKLWTTTADGSVKLRIDASCPQPPVTVHQMFLECVDKYGNLNGLSSKKNGVWEHITFLEYYKLCRRAAKSFLKLGLERFHSVGILGFNAPEWFISAVGTVFAGGITTGIYTTNSGEACHYVASDCRANIIVVENQKQLDKILQIWDKLPDLKAVVQYKGTLQVKRTDLYTWDEFLELGKDISEEHLDDIINSQKPNQCCVLIYTSGTTGNPKGVMLSHDNITWTAAHASRAGDMQPAEVQQESIVSYLPLSHIAAQIYDMWTGIKWGEHVYFANPDALKGTLVDTLRETQPTSHMGVPRVWEKIMERIKEASAQASALKKKMLSWAMSVNLERNLSPPRNCGKAVPGCQMKIVNKDSEGNGEICFWGRTVFMGYLNMEDKTKEVFDEDGWLHSGDIGKMDSDGFLQVTGRIKELIITAGGENIPPIPIEDSIKSHLSIVSNAVLIGDRRKFLSMLLTLKCTVDPESMEPMDNLTQEAIRFCIDAGSRATTVTEIVGQKDQAVYRAIQEGIDKVNSEAVSNAQRIQKWTVLPKDFSISGGEMGPTMKIKRHAILEKYKDVIETFYSG
ncbi:long-chain-fatty-acid--CoA ligase ACSBG1 isoform X2 [Pyxicephalus adspersus]|uniref:long-chain-fatty-acid--CoA ligase ACSBG1 isoform X2 n=1 Tax=Pyxicephalus adspersus TaxID=30357 RepID=UPI003B59652C